MRQIILASLVIPISLLAACGGADGGPARPGDAGEPADPAQTPPQGKAAIDPWLDAAHYKTWRCEQGIMDARPKGAHGRNRVCSNGLVSAATSTPYPVGAAAVKEMFDSQDQMVGLAVVLKVAASSGPSTWYWYERLRGSTAVDGVAVGVCSSCHAQAPADNIFIAVK